MAVAVTLPVSAETRPDRVALGSVSGVPSYCLAALPVVTFSGAGLISSRPGRTYRLTL